MFRDSYGHAYEQMKITVKGENYDQCRQRAREIADQFWGDKPYTLEYSFGSNKATIDSWIGDPIEVQFEATWVASRRVAE